MSAESLSLIAGTVLSLVFSYIPGAKNWFSKFNSQVKRLIMLGLIILSAGALYGMACLGWSTEFGITLTCDQTGFVVLLRQVMLAIIANQSIYSISPHRTGQGHQEAAGLSQFDDGTGGGS
jgi:hypothetical protein